MTKLYICGQAPSRVGDGRPFTGPSGRRLAALLMLRDYDHLASQATLVNIFNRPAARSPLPAGRRKHNAPGDEFDEVHARENGRKMVFEWAHEDEDVVVVACGLKVFQALTGERGDFFKGRRVDGVEIWCFPHPSGASMFWNSRQNVLRAANFLNRLLKRSGIVMQR